jgi:hypothetical protein
VVGGVALVILIGLFAQDNLIEEAADGGVRGRRPGHIHAVEPLQHLEQGHEVSDGEEVSLLIDSLSPGISLRSQDLATFEQRRDHSAFDAFAGVIVNEPRIWIGTDPMPTVRSNEHDLPAEGLAAGGMALGRGW